MEIYLVGGAVRDALLGLEPRERDFVVVGATPEELLARGFQPVGKDFPVFLHPETKEEYALARTERKSGRGYHGFTFHAAPGTTLEDDLRRRDLTINAIAQDGEGELIDPHQGAADLKAKILRHVSPAFVEDPVRVLRVARFVARLAPAGFRIADETLSLMREIVTQGECEHLVAERVWRETVRALGEASPRAFVETLRACGALKVIFPEVDALFGVPQKPEWHPEIDCGAHLLLVLDQAARLSDDTAVRFAALTHDLGKGITPADILPSHRGHEHAGVPLVRQLCRRLRVPRDYEQLAVMVCRDHLNCHRAHELSAKGVMRMLERTDALRRPERFKQFLVACEADARGRAGFAERAYPQAPYLQQCLKGALEVDVRGLIAQGYEGQVLGEQLRRARLRAIGELGAGRK